MTKSPDAFRTISEVAEWLGVQTHVLRFWESKFSQVKPVKRAGGRRYYRPTDMMLLGGIKTLLHDDGMTIKGVQKLLREEGVNHVSSFSQSLHPETQSEDTDTKIAENVVRFEARPEDRETAEPHQPARLDVAPAPAEDAPELDLPSPPAEPQTQPDAASLDAAPPSEPDPAEQPPATESPLPSFLTQPMGGAPDPEPVRPRMIDAPDPPPENEIPVAPGVLSRLARLDGLDAEQIRAVSPLLGRLAVLRDKLADASV